MVMVSGLPPPPPKLLTQSFDPAALHKKFQIFVDKYFDIWGKFGQYLTADLVF